jgi:long-chain acyl-CoA synthetase
MNLATLAERNLAEYGEYDRLVFEGRTHTNRELHERSQRLATAFGGIGLGRDDKVVVMLPNCPEVFVSYPAAWRAGLIVIPVLFLLEAEELAYILENSRAKAILTSPDFYDKVASAIRTSGCRVRVIVTGPAESIPAGTVSFDALVAANEPTAEIAPREGSDLATILYTSGTTGQPKGVMQTHANLYANVMNSWNTATNRDRREMSLLVLPLAHTFGLSALIAGYLFGARSVLVAWFNAEHALELIQKYKVAAMAGVPTMFVFMLFHPRRQEFDTSSVKRWLVGAAPMPVEQQREFEATFGGTMYVGYGLTEACPGVATEREGWPRKPGSTGLPLVGVDVKIVDDEGRTLPAGQIGEICARGENVSPGYYENPEATAETFRDGWLHTGDMGYLDEENYLFISERKKDLIIRGGFNVYPKDVEEVLYRHAAVQEAAVVGIPDKRMGEEVCACIVKRDGVDVTADELIRHCQSHLAKYKTPRYVEFVDSLPKTRIGKIQKKEVRRVMIEKLSS